MRVASLFKTLLILVVLLNFAGCTVIFQKGRRSDIEKISELSQEIDRLSKSKAILEERLEKEIAAKEVSLSMQEKGLVVSFLSEVLFDSGKADIRKKAYGSLDKVAAVLLKSAAGLDVGIEGHTDNQPIKYSVWKSNWELSGGRARSVLRYFIKKGVKPERLAFMGYGEYRPVASNKTAEGKQKNRRVEIVILPTMTKDRQLEEAKIQRELKENLK
ncbi:MAG: OmpA family protein [Candidatus Omnitrophica bacterium]|nr:OmpA family protein [Candidatus Omnitrophota bacterium]